ncbi:Uncharacterized protein Fot_29203 [Forsythia ovata]|uniref:Uncharacterized protein n=1 Tax=Forsythia ovata TaxID=205694 RepID=A0ABD1TR78_9LAMI
MKADFQATFTPNHPKILDLNGQTIKRIRWHTSLGYGYTCFYCDPSVAYSKHIVHIYAYHGGDDLRNHLEIDAHGGNVSDLAFSNPNKQLCIITCGEDKAIKR